MKNNIKLLYITHEYGSHIAGGIGRVINGISRYINEIFVLDIFHLQQGILKLGWNVHFYKAGSDKNKKKVYRFFYLHFLKRIVSIEKYTIVHIMNCGKIIENCIYLLKKEFPEIKIVYSCHSIVKHEINIRRNNPRDLNIEKNILDTIDHIHLLNTTSYKYLKNSYPSIIRKRPLSIIPNGINEEKYKKTTKWWKAGLWKKIKQDDIIISYISRWSHGKGFEYVLDAIPIVTRHIHNVKFILAGRKIISWEYKRKEYLKKIDYKLKKLKNHVITCGWLNDKQRNLVYSITDIYVMPSELEYFPYSILEPMVCKIPIVSARIECVEELLKENKDCLFFKTKNYKELAKNLLILISKEKLKEVLAKNAYKKVKNNFNWKVISDLYLKMYQMVNNRRLNNE
jgi:glycosyltransferase involved in cell wall biosynthesis